MTPIIDPSSKISSGYLLIDPLNLPPALYCEPLPTLPCTHADLTNIAELLPRLVDISALDDNQLQAIREILALQTAGHHPWAICAVLTCESSVAEISEHIGCFLRMVDGQSRPVFWRFFDPRVFSLLMAKFTVDQRMELLGPIREWQFAWLGNWWTASSNSGKSGGRPDVDVVAPSEAQWQILRMSRLVDGVLLRIAQDSPLSHAECLRSQLAVIDYLAEGSLELHLSETEDLIDFAYLSLKYGHAFRTCPKFKLAKPELAARFLGWFTFRNSLNATDFIAFDESKIR